MSDQLGKAKAAAQGPLQAVRGSGEQETMLQNARIEYAEEAHEIATYTVIDALATTAGDTETAKLAREILRDEERMQKFLAKLLPELTANVAHDEIPVSELAGHRRRRPRRSRSARTGRARPGASSSTRAAPGCALE